MTAHPDAIHFVETRESGSVEKLIERVANPERCSRKLLEGSGFRKAAALAAVRDCSLALGRAATTPASRT